MAGVQAGGTWAIALLMLLLLPACATVPANPSLNASLPVNDPYENMNRQVMAANLEVLRPVSAAVKAVVPGPVHDRLHDLNSNLREPRIFLNNVLQGRFQAAAHTGGRFLVNSTFGLGGLLDVASREGWWQQESGDFGQTLFVWGFAEGPYVVRPYLGPSTLRDAIGSTIDMVANPLGRVIGPQLALSSGSQFAVSAAGTGVDAVDRLGQLKQAEDASIDFYSFIRSSYYQMRRAELREAIGLPSAVESPATSDIEDPAPESKATPR